MGAGDLLLPIGYVQHRGVPQTMRSTSNRAVGNHQEAGDLAYMLGGRSAMPKAPVLVWGPDNRTVIMLVGDGVTEAAELQDMALEAIERQEEQIARNGRGMDYDAMREKHGYVSRENAGNAISDAIAERIAHHKANPVTDPFRQPRRALGNMFNGVSLPAKEE